MANTLPPIPYKVPMLNQSGFLNQAWEKWFRDLFQRLGGSVALSNAELNSALTTAQSDIDTLQTQVATNTTAISIITDGIGVGPVL